MPRALPHRVVPADHGVRCLVGEHRQLGVEQRHIDRRALARCLAPVKRGEDRVRGVEPGEQVGDRDPDTHRPATGLAIGQSRQAHQPAHPLDDIVVASARRIRSVLPKASDRGVDQPGVRGAQAGRVEPEFLEAPDLEILDQHVGVGRHLANQCRTVVSRKIDRHRALAAVGGEVISRDLLALMLVPRRPPVARVVPRAGLLDLDHFGAKIGEQLRRPRPGKHPRQVEHADPFERLLHARRRHGLRSARIDTAALCPGAPVTPPPGCAPDPHRYSPGSGIR